MADLLVALMPLGAVLLAYFFAALVNASLSASPIPHAENAFGFTLHVTEPIAADRALFTSLPSPWLQEKLHPTDQPHWWDAVVAVVYSSHFVVVPLLAVLLWFRRRHRFRPFIWSVFTLVTVGVCLYVIYPMVPPWMAARDGHVETIARISGIGWDWLGLDFVNGLQTIGQTSGNTVAAMPSLHAGAAALVTAFLWTESGWWFRALGTTYTLTMGVALVYAGEHYAIDVIVGIVLAVAAVALVTAVGRWSRREPGEAGMVRRRPVTSHG